MMTFVELMVKEQPEWQSKDLIVLLYEETDYSFAVKEFLESYYASASENPFEKKIHGRCGYIRQAIPFIIKDYDFGKISLMIDGVNSQLSDIDFYD